MRTLVFVKSFVISLMLIWLPPQFATANGAAWNLGEHTGTPGPIKQTDLMLEKEHVIFKDKKVTARFWIHNPTDTPINVNMGFPIFVRDIAMDRDPKIKEQIIKDYENRNSKNTVISVNGQIVSKTLSSQSSGAYNIVWQWAMKFAPKSLTEFTVEYPIDAPWQDMGDSKSLNFVYITHTGSYWAKPIKDATFEYYSPQLVNLILNYPTGSYWNDFQEEYETEILLKWAVTPEPFEIDKERGRIVWHRGNWLPQKDNDDIKIDINITYGWGAPCIDNCTDNSMPVFSEYCGADNNQIFHEEHFGKRMKITEIELDNNSLSKLEYEAYYYDREKGQKYNNLPKHLRLRHTLNVLRYLRNYIYATHGHNFKDRDLAKCYKKVEQRTNWSQIEKNNISFIENMEKILMPAYKSEIKKIKSINESVYESISTF